MRWLTPTRMIILGTILMVLGVILPFLMVVKVITSTYFLNFFSYGASLSGMFLGAIGFAYYFKGKNKKG